ncbi:hypothetical protein ARMA_0757 [Ardenticatena maritima]|uniref:Uncharacterized protein n=1 Tax=Ardenticatena maritima TaxID=872965 RepID=A0A0N0RFD1_9CHLR|nr:hypothetical protein ARMA_0757 [Ardenticatena maritima]
MRAHSSTGKKTRQFDLALSLGACKSADCAILMKTNVAFVFISH